MTNATIKDALIELNNDVITTSLSAYGHVVPGSLRMGKMRGSNILNGLRYVELLDVENTIPTGISMAEYTVRVYCDNGKTECKHCGYTSHPSYKCLIRPRNERRCYTCYSTSQLIDQCDNEVVCRYCSQPRHKEERCDA